MDKENNSKTIYLDNAATTFPKPESVYTEMDYVNRNLAVNTGRGSYSLARKATEIIDRTREKALKLVKGKDVADIVLTPSATIAMNVIIGGLDWSGADICYVSPFEHNAVMRPLHLISEKYGFDLIELPLKSETLEIEFEKMEYMFSMNPPTKVFATHISNVTGYILPVKEITEMAKKYNVELVVRSSLNRSEGTVVKEGSNMEKLLVTGVAADKDTVRISVIGLEDKPGTAFAVFNTLAANNINVDIILQSVGREGTKDISFTVASDDLEHAIEVLNANKERLTIQDITCDSDGKINNFISTRNFSYHLPVHELSNKEPYYFGVFLVGAYQEILGDLHNLFGDTNAVHIKVKNGEYVIDKIIEGETVADVLEYVQFTPKRMARTVEVWATTSVKKGIISPEEGREFLSNYRSGLYGYTYLE